MQPAARTAPLNACVRQAKSAVEGKRVTVVGHPETMGRRFHVFVLLPHVDWNTEQQQQSVEDRRGAAAVHREDREEKRDPTLGSALILSPAPTLVLRRHRLTASQQRIAAERYDNKHGQSPSVDTRMALIVCIRFSACSNAMLQRDSKTSFVTSIPLVSP